jgi:hypothetical protein
VGGAFFCVFQCVKSYFIIKGIIKRSIYPTIPIKMMVAKSNCCSLAEFTYLTINLSGVWGKRVFFRFVSGERFRLKELFFY